MTRSGGKGQLEARGGSQGQMGVGHWRQDGGSKGTGVGYQTGVVGYQTGMGYQTEMMGFQTGWWMQVRF